MNARFRNARFLVFGLLFFAIGQSASAGPYGDALAKCLVSATTPAEKTTLVRWMFAMVTLHPDVADISGVTPEQRTALSKEVGQLFERLLTQSCAKEAREAIRYEGTTALETSFAVLGQVAARELFAHPKVSEGMSEFTKYIDEKKIEDLVAPQEQ